MHILLTLRGSTPRFIYISDGKYHDVNTIDETEVVHGAIHVLDKAYVDFKRRYELGKAGVSYFIRPEENLQFMAVLFRKINNSTGLHCDQSIKFLVPKRKKSP